MRGKYTGVFSAGVPRPARKSPGRTVSRQGNTLSLLPSGPDEVRCACCTGPGLIPAGRKTGGIVTRRVVEPGGRGRTSSVAILDGLAKPTPDRLPLRGHPRVRSLDRHTVA